MNVAETVKNKTEKYSEFLLSGDEPFFKQLLNGTLSVEHYAVFLANVRYLVEHTPKHLKLAVEKSKGKPELRSYFEHKFQEEVGHDQWATDDLQTIKPLMKKDESEVKVTQEMKDYVASIQKAIEEDPYLYPCYIYYTEYLTVLVGDAIDHAVTHKCKFGEKAATIVTDHAELDKHHIEEGKEAIDSLIDSKAYETKAATFIDEIIKSHQAMFRSCLRH